MLFAFFLTLLLAIILFFTQPKENEANRWMVTFCLTAAMGALSAAIDIDIIPSLKKAGIVFPIHFLVELRIYCQFLCQVITPYAILMYAIVYSEIVKVKTKRILAYLLGIPMVIMIFFTDFYPDIEINFQVLLIWTAPYYLIASYLMFKAWHREVNTHRKKGKFRVFIILVPLWLGVFVLNNVMEAVHPNQQLYRIVPLFFFIAYILLGGFLFISGVFGIKVKVEQQVLDKSMQIMSGGTSILNHTIKNEVSKIKFFFNIAQNAIEKKDLDEAKKSIESVFSAIEGIDNMVDRIRAKTEEIVLKESNVEMVSLLKECVHRARDIFSTKGIKITTDFKGDVMFYGDEMLLKEVVNNILNNAMEAIDDPKGLIHVRMFKMKNQGISIEISDNGKGIPKEEINRIMEPYFSTKQNIKNHGLGLSFCYKVIRAHEGEIMVKSEVDKGTTVIIHFPQIRINQNLKKL
ncbi:sensor histidine kinase [Priestia filamentosa]|uniref:sensor histidine kinase n=1 Tax=Priestia filamentosa TaxID=1402861 RepID=UPI000319ADA8|nr:sensor histidine kinase [Priestia filamentosa]